MKRFNNLEEMRPYHNKNTNTYEFNDDVYFGFDLAIHASINAQDIKASNIDAFNISAKNITAYNIEALDIKADRLIANDINANNVKADSIVARDITFYAVCFAYNNFDCRSIMGLRKNSKYFCLNNEVIVKNAE